MWNHCKVRLLTKAICQRLNWQSDALYPAINQHARSPLRPHWLHWYIADNYFIRTHRYWHVNYLYACNWTSNGRYWFVSDHCRGHCVRPTSRVWCIRPDWNNASRFMWLVRHYLPSAPRRGAAGIVAVKGYTSSPCAYQFMRIDVTSIILDC